MTVEPFSARMEGDRCPDPEGRPLEKKGRMALEKGRAADEFWMRRALALARSAGEAGDVPVGAVLVCGDEAVAFAENERERSGDPTAHAEILALRRGAEKLGRWNLSDCTLYVSLEPCPMCAGAVLAARPGRVVFAAFHKEGGACGSRVDLTPLAPGIRFEGGLLHEEASELLRAFFRDRRETFY